MFNLRMVERSTNPCDVSKLERVCIIRIASGAMSLILCVGCAWEMIQRVQNESVEWMYCPWTQQSALLWTPCPVQCMDVYSGSAKAQQPQHGVESSQRFAKLLFLLCTDSNSSISGI